MDISQGQCSNGWQFLSALTTLLIRWDTVGCGIHAVISRLCTTSSWGGEGWRHQLSIDQCKGMNVYVPASHQIHMLESIPQGHLLRVEALGKWLGRTLISGLNVLMKEAWGSFFSPSTMWGCSKKVPSLKSGETSPDNDSEGTLILDFPVSRTEQ
jgi:hypothetical protein